MTLSEVNTAITDLRNLSDKICNTIFKLRERGFVINDNKYCRLTRIEWLIDLFNYLYTTHSSASATEDITSDKIDLMYNRIIRSNG